MSTCPSDETLARLGHDSLDVANGPRSRRMSQHCEKCVGVLEKLVSDDTATGPASASLPAEESLPHIPGFDDRRRDRTRGHGCGLPGVGAQTRTDRGPEDRAAAAR